jgi:2-oxoglutarate ferredoxin oxidoreductase subunit gamma
MLQANSNEQSEHIPVDRLELKMAGIGGQGVLLGAQLFARAGLRHYTYVTWFPSYGTQKRGGESTCTVILSSQRIHSPILSRPKTMIVMHGSALERCESTVASGGLLVVDGSLVQQQITRPDVSSCYVPANAVANELGSAQLSNMILLGALVCRTQALPLATVESALDEMMREEGRARLIPKSIEALRRGFTLAS